MANWRLWMPPALEVPRVRLYVAGHVVSVLGNWAQQIALSWLIYRLSESVFLLGVAGFLLNISYLLFGGIAGSLADRLPRMQTLVAIDLASASLAVALAVCVFSGVATVTPYLVLAALIGIASGFEMPVRQSLFKDIVGDKRLLPSAIALSATTYNLGRMIGPALAGFALLYVSEGWLFLFNAASYAAIIAALFAMNLPAEARVAQSIEPRPPWRESLHIIVAFPCVRYLLPTVAALGMFATPYAALMPSIVDTFFDGKPSTVGWLMGSAGLGALVTAFYLSMQPGTGRQLRLVSIAPYIVGGAMLIFAWSRSMTLSTIVLVALGAAMIATANTTNALLQQSVPDAWRGRVIGVYAMAFAGVAPIGSLVAGALAARIGLTATLTLNAVCLIAAAVIAGKRLHDHPEALRSILRAIRS